MESAEAWLDLESRVGLISEAISISPAQRAIMPKYLQSEMSAAFERALALLAWEQEQQKEKTK
jgi:hypothetical protein